MAKDRSVAEITRLVELIRPLLAGHPPEIQGAALADLTAIWLAGHVCIGNPGATAELREDLLKRHIDTIRKLTPINAKAIGTDG